jgi:C-terminal processing protease CtpA/Prc
MRHVAAFLLSIVFHVFLLYSTISSIKKIPSEKYSDNRAKIKVLEKENKTIVKNDNMSSSKSKIAVKHKTKKTKKIKCEKYYTGVGIMTQPDTCIITRVYKGYSAHKAGLISGDIIISPDCSSIRGPEGSIIKIKIMRETKIIDLNITREKICEQNNTRP